MYVPGPHYLCLYENDQEKKQGNSDKEKFCKRDIEKAMQDHMDVVTVKKVMRKANLKPRSQI